MSAPFIPAIKAALNALGRPAGSPRKPVHDLDAATAAKISYWRARFRSCRRLGSERLAPRVGDYSSTGRAPWTSKRRHSAAQPLLTVLSLGHGGGERDLVQHPADILEPLAARDRCGRGLGARACRRGA